MCAIGSDGACGSGSGGETRGREDDGFSSTGVFSTAYSSECLAAGDETNRNEWPKFLCAGSSELELLSVFDTGYSERLWGIFPVTFPNRMGNAFLKDSRAVSKSPLACSAMCGWCFHHILTVAIRKIKTRIKSITRNTGHEIVKKIKSTPSGEKTSR